MESNHIAEEAEMRVRLAIHTTLLSMSADKPEIKSMSHVTVPDCREASAAASTTTTWGYVYCVVAFAGTVFHPSLRNLHTTLGCMNKPTLVERHWVPAALAAAAAPTPTADAAHHDTHTLTHELRVIQAYERTCGPASCGEHQGYRSHSNSFNPLTNYGCFTIRGMNQYRMPS